MARINVDESLFTDPKILYLSKKLGLDRSIGLWVLITRTAQRYLDERLIPKLEVKLLDLPDEIFDAEILIESENGYQFAYDDQFDWLRKSKDAGRKGAEKRWKKDKETIKKDSDPMASLSNPNGVECLLTPTLTPTLTQSNTSKDDSSQKKKNNEISKKAYYADIINYLNKTTGSKLDPNGKSHRKIIDHWYDKGKPLEDFFHIIKVKWAEWKDNPDMKKFTKRPQTLFGKTHFDDYRSQEMEYDPVDNAFSYLKQIQGELENVGD